MCTITQAYERSYHVRPRINRIRRYYSYHLNNNHVLLHFKSSQIVQSLSFLTSTSIQYNLQKHKYTNNTLMSPHNLYHTHEINWMRLYTYIRLYIIKSSLREYSSLREISRKGKSNADFCKNRSFICLFTSNR